MLADSDLIRKHKELLLKKEETIAEIKGIEKSKQDYENKVLNLDKEITTIRNLLATLTEYFNLERRMFEREVKRTYTQDWEQVMVLFDKGQQVILKSLPGGIPTEHILEDIPQEIPELTEIGGMPK